MMMVVVVGVGVGVAALISRLRGAFGGAVGFHTGRRNDADRQTGVKRNRPGPLKRRQHVRRRFRRLAFIAETLRVPFHRGESLSHVNTLAG